MKLRELIEENLTDRDLKEVLDNLNLDHSGSRDELLDRLSNGLKGKSANEALSLFPSETLMRICKKGGIKQDWPFFIDTNEQMIRKISSRILEKGVPNSKMEHTGKLMESSHPIKEAHNEKDKESHSKPETIAGSPLSQADSAFEVVVNDTEAWLPRANHRSEAAYRDDLSPWLWSRGHHTTIRKGDSTVDVLVDDKYPIMIIIEPKISDFHRAFGQIHRHLEVFQSVILVICRPKQDGELEFFEERVRRSLTYSKHPYKIIRKN